MTMNPTLPLSVIQDRLADITMDSYMRRVVGDILSFDREIDIPVVPDLFQRINRAITEEGGHLDMGSWHTCNTSHCLAGWMVHVVPFREGYDLEDEADFDPAIAALAIYAASCPWALPALPQFYPSEYESIAEDILAIDWVRTMAEREAHILGHPAL